MYKRWGWTHGIQSFIIHNMSDSKTLALLARRIRYDILTMTTRAGSGHPTSSLSAVELMTVLFFNYLRYDVTNPTNPGNDRVIFSKGHASPLYYALYAAAGALTQKDLEGYRTFDSTLEGHPTARFTYTEAATGSLGQGLSIGLGEALALRLQSGNAPPRVFVLAGDGELAEGAVWEAVAAASFRKVNNLFLLCDINRLGQSDPTMYEYDLGMYKKRFEAFGWRAVIVEDGNDIEAIDRAYIDTFKGPTLQGGLTVILAKTKKGAGVSFLENADSWHGKPLSKEELTKAVAELGDIDLTRVGTVQKPENIRGLSFAGDHTDKTFSHTPPKANYDPAKPVATRKAFGNALKRLGASNPRLIVIDGDVKNSTYTEYFGKEFPERFFELFIAEQNMAGVATGLSARGFRPVVSSFACFLTRAADQFRMASFSAVNMIVNGSHAGVSIGADGPSQMGLEDLAIFRAIHGSTVLYPSDAYCTEALVEEALKAGGIVYIRTTRPETPILYDAKESFPIGGSKVFEQYNKTAMKQCVATVVAAGITLHESLKAQKELASQGMYVRVIDCYSIKPIDQKTLHAAANDSKAIIVVEDHYPEGGLGEAVQSALFASNRARPCRVVHLAVTKTPRSGKSGELLAYEGIDAQAIIKTVRSLISIHE